MLLLMKFFTDNKTIKNFTNGLVNNSSSCCIITPTKLQIALQFSMSCVQDRVDTSTYIFSSVKWEAKCTKYI